MNKPNVKIKKPSTSASKTHSGTVGKKEDSTNPPPVVETEGQIVQADAPNNKVDCLVIGGPSRHKTLKVSLKLLIKEGVDYTNLYATIINANRVTKLSLMFMRAFILYAIENKIELNHISNEAIRFATKICLKRTHKKSGKKSKKEDLGQLKPLMKKFYQDHYANAVRNDKTESKPPSGVITLVCKDVYTQITNNIVFKFDNQIIKFLRAHFIKPDEVTSMEHNEKLNNIKGCLYTNTKYGDDVIDNWIGEYLPHIIPTGFAFEKISTDADRNNFKYMRCMHYINSYLQTVTTKSYQIFPLRTQLHDNYVKLDTSALIQIFHPANINIFGKDQLKCLKSKTTWESKEIYWNKMFRFKSKKGKWVYKLHDYVFNHEISTDGCSVSLNFIHKDDVIKKQAKNAAMKAGRKEVEELSKKSPKEAAKLSKKKEDDKMRKKELAKQKAKEIREKAKEEFKLKSPEEKEIIKNKMNMDTEFPYIERLIFDHKKKEEIQKAMKERRLVVVDPGMRSILYMMGSNNPSNGNKQDSQSESNDSPTKKKMNHYGIKLSKDGDKKFFNYTCHTRRHFLKTKKYEERRNQWRVTGIKLSSLIEGEHTVKSVFEKLQDLEEQISLHNSKSCNLDEFYKYINVRIELMDHIRKHYDTELLKRLQWYAHLNKQKHELELMNQISTEFGPDVVIIIGDWSAKGRVRFMPTPNISLKRKLASRFTVYTIDEFRTSILHHEHEIKCKNLVSKSKYSIEKKRMIDKQLKNHEKEKELRQELKDTDYLERTFKMDPSIRKLRKRGVHKQIKTDLPDRLVDLKNSITVSMMNEEDQKRIQKLEDDHVNMKFKNDQERIQDREITEIAKSALISGVVVKDYQKGKKHLHSVLTYQVVNKEVDGVLNPQLERHKRSGCINRDRNSTYNMLKIVKSLLLTGKRPEKYRREIKLDEYGNILKTAILKQVPPKSPVVKDEGKTIRQVVSRKSLKK